MQNVDETLYPPNNDNALSQLLASIRESNFELLEQHCLLYAHTRCFTLARAYC